VLALEIAEELEAALEQFAAIAEDLTGPVFPRNIVAAAFAL
jgi:hypothetical protein